MPSDLDLPVLRELRDDLSRAYRKPPPPRRRWALPAGGLTAAAAAAAAVVVGVSGSSPSRATAAEVLHHAARAAAAQADEFPRDDQYFYVESHTGNLSTSQSDAGVVNALITTDREIWTSIDNPGRLVEHVTGVKRLTGTGPVPEGVGDSANDPPIDAEEHYALGGEALSRAQMLAYPTDAHAIYDRLRAHPGGGQLADSQVFTDITDALREAPAPAALRSGLYDALALVPGITLVGHVTDDLGRNGVAVAFTDTENAVRTEVIFDPQTADMLAERSVVVDGAGKFMPPAGTVIGDTTYVKRAVTDAPR